jgi:hypothetical protein
LYLSDLCGEEDDTECEVQEWDSSTNEGLPPTVRREYVGIFNSLSDEKVDPVSKSMLTDMKKGMMMYLHQETTCEGFFDHLVHLFIFVQPFHLDIFMNMKKVKLHDTHAYTKKSLSQNGTGKTRKGDGVVIDGNGTSVVVFENSLSRGSWQVKRTHTSEDRSKLTRARERAMANHSSKSEEGILSGRFFSLQLGHEEEGTFLVEGKVSFVQNGMYWHNTLFSETLRVDADEAGYILLARHVHAFWHLVKAEVDLRNETHSTVVAVSLDSKNDNNESKPKAEEGSEPKPKSNDATREPYPEKKIRQVSQTPKKKKKKASTTAPRTVLSTTQRSTVSLTNNGLYAIKQSTSDTAAETELRALVALQRVPRVVRLLGVEPSSRAFKLELLKPVLWPSLSKDIPRLREFMQSLVRSVCEVHAAGWAHRDLKPANIMCRAGDLLPVLLDFDAASTATTHHDAFEQEGTAGFTFWNSPATRAWQHDCVCLGVILGLVLGIDQFGNPDHDGINTLHTFLEEASDLPTGAADACRALLRAKLPLKDILLLPFFSRRTPLGQRSTNAR